MVSVCLVFFSLTLQVSVSLHYVKYKSFTNISHYISHWSDYIVQEALHFLGTFYLSTTGRSPSPEDLLSESSQTKGVCVCTCVSLITDSPYF